MHTQCLEVLVYIFMHTHSQFLMPGLVDCHLHPAQYLDAGTEPLAFFDFVVNTLIPTEVIFRNTTIARETSMALIVSRFYSAVIYVHIFSKLCVTVLAT